MTMIIETGAGIANSNSYVSAAEATTYLAAYEPAGYESWPSDQPSQEAALLIGCQALEMMFQNKFLGIKRQPSVTDLSFPRYAFYDMVGNLYNGTTIPSAVKQAQATLALYYVLGEDIFPQDSKESRAVSESVKIGDISTSTSYSSGTSYDPLRKVTLLLGNILRPTQTMSIVR